MSRKHRLTAWIMILAMLCTLCCVSAVHAEKSYKLSISLAENDQFTEKDKVKVNLYRIATASDDNPADWQILTPYASVDMTAAASSYSNMVKHAEEIVKIINANNIKPELASNLDRDGRLKVDTSGGVLLLTIAEAPEGFTATPYLINIPAYDGEHYVEETLSIIKYEYNAPTPEPPPPAVFRCVKVDTAGNPLPNVQFRLRNVDTNKIVSKATSDKKGEFELYDVTPGDWLIQEVSAPTGYNKMDDIRVHVDEDLKVPVQITCVNIPDHFEFVKVDNMGNPIPGVKFSVEDADGNIISRPVSDANGLVMVKMLAPGRYVIRETDPAPGYQLSSETIVVTIDENYVVAEERQKFINYPNIQTGVEISNPWMIAGGAVLVLALAAIVVIVVLKRKKPKK